MDTSYLYTKTLEQLKLIAKQEGFKGLSLKGGKMQYIEALAKALEEKQRVKQAVPENYAGEAQGVQTPDTSDVIAPDAQTPDAQTADASVGGAASNAKKRGRKPGTSKSKPVQDNEKTEAESAEKRITKRAADAEKEASGAEEKPERPAGRGRGKTAAKSQLSVAEQPKAETPAAEETKTAEAALEKTKKAKTAVRRSKKTEAGGDKPDSVGSTAKDNRAETTAPKEAAPGQNETVQEIKADEAAAGLSAESAIGAEPRTEEPDAPSEAKEEKNPEETAENGTDTGAALADTASADTASADTAEASEAALPRSTGVFPAEMGDGAGVLEILAEGYGFLRAENCLPGPRDAYLSSTQIRRFNLRNGDYITGKTRPQRDGDRSEGMVYVSTVNGGTADAARRRPHFEDLVPVFPNERLRLEGTKEDADPALRTIDLIAPIGKGQRGLIVSPPKAGKTVLLKKIANAITENYPDVQLMVLLIDERPEEVTDMQRSTAAEVMYSTFDEEPENHCKLSEMVLDKARRQVEMGRDVVILLDSITRLARAYNLVIPPTGRSLSGGLDPGALYKPKKFFGSARNIENGGSLTIIATALVDTGSRLDDIIYEEFKGTGNMELHLDRELSERRIFPAIDVSRSGTRKEELLYTPQEAEGALLLRKNLTSGNRDDTEQLISLLVKTHNNEAFLERLKGWLGKLTVK